MSCTNLLGFARQIKNYWQGKVGQCWQWWDEHPPEPALGRKDRLQTQIDCSPRRYDGYDSSRQGVALYAREGETHQPYRVELEVAHLRPGAERTHLDSRFHLRWPGQTWTIEVDHQGQAEHNTLHNRVQLRLDKEKLREKGWKDGQPLQIEVTTHHQDQPEVCSRLTAQSDVRENLAPFRWEGKSIYYAVTDRFFNGDPANDQGTHPKQPLRFHGGDWKGLTEKLDYLQDLGVDALWISCPYLNQRNFQGSDGFHGYWPEDFRQAEPSFGNKADLKELIDQAHQRGLKVLLDVVTNHTAYDHPWTQSRPDWFHQEGEMWGILPSQVERGQLSGLPDLAQERPDVAAYLTDVHRDWLALGFDGFRLDAIRHVPESFTRDFQQAMKSQKPDFFSLGEVFWQSPNYVSGYQNRTVDSVFDFPLAYAIRDVFAGDPSRTPEVRRELSEELRQLNDQEAERMLLRGDGSRSMKRLSKVLAQDYLYDNPGKLATMIDNHDMSRFMSDTGGDIRKQELALAFLYAVRGTPCVYYGSEVAMEGFGVENRNDMEWGKNPALTDRFCQMVQCRKDSEALQWGTQVERLVTHDTLALSRVRADEEVVCLFNNAEEARKLRVPLPHLPAGSKLHELFSGRDGLCQDGVLEVELPAKGYAYYQFKGV